MNPNSIVISGSNDNNIHGASAANGSGRRYERREHLKRPLRQPLMRLPAPPEV